MKNSLTISEACQYIEKNYGRKPSICSVWRWMRKGTRGRKLNSFLLGGTRCTNADSIAAFFSVDTTPSAAVPTAMPAARSGHAAASAELDKLGI